MCSLWCVTFTADAPRRHTLLSNAKLERKLAAREVSDAFAQRVTLSPAGHGQAYTPAVSVLSANGIVEKFIVQWNASDLRDKMPEPMLTAHGLRVKLTAIGVYERHQRSGCATRALRMLTTLCDENGVTIELIARPLGLNLIPGCPATLPIERLIAWYSHYGFVDVTVPGDDTRTMVREPQRDPFTQPHPL